MELVTPGLIGVLIVFLAVFIYWIVVFIILYHLVRFGIGIQPKKIALAFLLGTTALFCVGMTCFYMVDFGAVLRSLSLLLGIELTL